MQPATACPVRPVAAPCGLPLPAPCGLSLPRAACRCLPLAACRCPRAAYHCLPRAGEALLHGRAAAVRRRELMLPTHFPLTFVSVKVSTHKGGLHVGHHRACCCGRGCVLPVGS